MPHPAAPAVLLDLDGTLIASYDGIVSGLQRGMADLGHTLPPDEKLDWVIGPPLHDSLLKLLRDRGDDRVDLAVERYRHHYEIGGAMFESPAFPGIETALEQLHGAGYRLILATSKPRHMALQILERKNFTRFFSAFYGANPDDSGAEKPELIARLIREQHVDPRHAVMVGDRRYDINGAHANGVRALGVLWGYGGRAELEQAGADALVERTDELVAAIELSLHARADSSAAD